MLGQFLTDNRSLLLERAHQLVSARHASPTTDLASTHRLPAFFDQLLSAVRCAALTGESDHSELSRSAVQHGHASFSQGLSVGQVVQDYGGLCQVITGLAVDNGVTIPNEELQTLNLCLDNSIAAAVTEFGRQRAQALGAEGTERLGVLAHEMRNHLNTAMLAFTSIRKGVVAVGGPTGSMLERSLMGLQSLVDRSFADVRLQAGLHARKPIVVHDLMEELQIAASMFATAHGQTLVVRSVLPSIVIEGDRQILTAALNNLLQNAFKFSRPGATIALNASSSETRVCFDVEDECGGLPPGRKESLLKPFVQRSKNRSGLGLGLAICVKSVQAMGGELRVRDLPGKGCTFTIDLPRPTQP